MCSLDNNMEYSGLWGIFTLTKYSRMFEEEWKSLMILWKVQVESGIVSEEFSSSIQSASHSIECHQHPRMPGHDHAAGGTTFLKIDFFPSNLQLNITIYKKLPLVCLSSSLSVLYWPMMGHNASVSSPGAQGLQILKSHPPWIANVKHGHLLSIWMSSSNVITDIDKTDFLHLTNQGPVTENVNIPPSWKSGQSARCLISWYLVIDGYFDVKILFRYISGYFPFPYDLHFNSNLNGPCPSVIFYQELKQPYGSFSLPFNLSKTK